MKVRKTIEIGELFRLLKINEQGKYAAPKSLKVKTENGFKKVNGLLKTQENPEWVVKTKNRKAVFTDYHRLETSDKSDQFDVNKNWSFVKNLKNGDKVKTEDGFEEVEEVYFNGKYSQMYDLQVDGSHFLANGFNSHNTALLGNFAINNFLNNKKSLVYTLETHTRRLLARFYANLLEMTKKELVIEKNEAKEKFDDVLGMTEGDLIIKDYNANTVNSNDLLAHINNLSTYKEWVPDIIIVDYILLMKTNDIRMSSDNSYKYYKTITEELRNLASTLNVPVITATQINRHGQDERGGTKQITTSKDISESRGIYDTADFFATINQTRKDKDKEQILLYIDKWRNGQVGDKIRCEFDYEHMKIREI